MALIECTECGHKVSDKAECCPNCGCSIEEIMSADASNNTNVSQVYDDAVQFDDIPPKKSKGWLWTIVVILVLAAIGVGVWLFTNGKLGEDDPTTAKVEITPEFIAAVHQYDELYPFSEGLAAVKKDGKFGYIDTKGNLVIPCQFGYASDFIEGTAVVAKDDGMPYCILNRDGRVVETKYILKDNSRYIESDGSLSQSSETYILNGEYVGFYTLTETKDNGDNVAHYLDKNLKEVTEPSESLLRDFAPDSVYTEYFESGKDYLGNDEYLSGLKDKKGTIIIPARYTYVRMCDNCVALAEIRVEPADFHQEGLTVFGYIDLNGNSTFTDADFKKIEAYKQEQLEELDRIAAEEEQARLEEERRQMGTDFVVTMTADFNKYGEICNESSTIGHIIRFRDSFETKYYVVPKGKRMKYLYYREHNNNISIYDDLRIDIYDEDNRNLVAQHNLRECGEFNILSGQRFGIKAHTIGCHSSNEYRDCHFNMEFVFKVFDE